MNAVRTQLFSAARAFIASAACMAKRYVLLRDHFSNTLYGAAPIEWLTKWLAAKGAGPTVDSKYFRMDLGGELGRCQEILDLFTQAGYTVEPTAPNSLHQNRPIERPYRETLEIRSVPCSRVPLWHLVWAVCVLSLPSTPQHDYSR
jgi:hypothetical protein